MRQRDNGNGQRHAGTPSNNPLGDFLQNVAHTPNLPNALKDFVNPGDTPEKLLMRTNFIDHQQANAMVMTIHKIRYFDMSDACLELMIDKMASLTSIGGLRMREFLQGVTGVLAPDLYNIDQKAQKKGLLNRNNQERARRDEDED